MKQDARGAKSSDGSFIVRVANFPGISSFNHSNSLKHLWKLNLKASPSQPPSIFKKFHQIFNEDGKFGTRFAAIASVKREARGWRSVQRGGGEREREERWRAVREEEAE